MKYNISKDILLNLPSNLEQFFWINSFLIDTGNGRGDFPTTLFKSDIWICSVFRVMIVVSTGFLSIPPCHLLCLELMTDKSSCGEWMVTTLNCTLVQHEEQSLQGLLLRHVFMDVTRHFHFFSFYSRLQGLGSWYMPWTLQ